MMHNLMNLFFIIFRIKKRQHKCKDCKRTIETTSQTDHANCYCGKILFDKR